ncbi:MAG: 30S ribosomal protein S15 [Candidatus Omnitrophica bacterium]|nr:30S ribosomal protein S15 [Candidatus Omnitrophota bacterium]
MALEKTRKQELIKTYKDHDSDTGSPAVQIALLTERINLLTDHFKSHKSDYQSRRGLLKLVSVRRRLLDYLKKRDVKQYEGLLEKLNIRK